MLLQMDKCTYTSTTIFSNKSNWNDNETQGEAGFYHLALIHQVKGGQPL